MIRTCATILIIILVGSNAVAQSEYGLKFKIVVKHKGEPYPSSIIKVYKNNSFLDQVSVSNEGELTYIMPYTGVYQLHFTGVGMATKVLELDLITHIPEEEKGTIHEWSIGEIELFKAYKELDLDKLKEPIAKIHYAQDLAEFDIDYKYTGKRKKELATIENKVEQFEKKEAIAEKAAKKEYEELVIQGNQALNNKQFDKAKSFYEKAVVIKPEGEAKQKLTAINTVLATEKKYETLLADAKTLRDKGELQQASEKYIAASAIKPTATFPKEQVSLLVQEMRTKEQQANSFNNYMAVANRAYANGNFEAAAQSYNKALDLNPDALLASKKLKLSEQKINEQEKQEQVDNKFSSLLVDAKNARSRGDVEQAQAFLKQAALLKPNNDELKQEQKTVSTMVVEQEQKEQLALQRAAAIEKEKAEEVEKYITLAEKSVAEGNKKQALFFYSKAKQIRPENKKVLAGIATANNMNGSKQSTSDEAVTADIDKMDKKSVEFQSKLASLYPEGKTVNESTKGNKNITQVIIVKDGIGVEYQKIKYSWGGVYYFKNGDPITELIYSKETK